MDYKSRHSGILTGHLAHFSLGNGISQKYLNGSLKALSYISKQFICEVGTQKELGIGMRYLVETKFLVGGN